MKSKWEVRAERRFQMNRIALAVFVTTQNGERLVAAPVALNAYSDQEIIEPLLTLSHDEAQLLMEELWQAGVRPAQAAGSVGQLGAVEKHVADMRSIAFGALNFKGLRDITQP